jgi:hypothetical protein
MINHQAEKAAVAEVTEHSYGCFEQIAEELVEAGIAQTGEFDEELTPGGRTVLVEFLTIVVEQPSRCSCPVNEEEEEGE